MASHHACYELRCFLPKHSKTTIWPAFESKPRGQERRSDDYLVINDTIGLKWRSSQHGSNDKFEMKLRTSHNPLTGCETWAKYTGLRCPLPASLPTPDSREQFKLRVVEALQTAIVTSDSAKEILRVSVRIISDPSFDVAQRLLRVKKARRQMVVQKKHLKLPGLDQAALPASLSVVVEQAHFTISQPFLEDHQLVAKYRSICIEGQASEANLLKILRALILDSACRDEIPYLIAGYPQYLRNLLSL